MKRDHQKIDKLVESTSTCSEKVMDIGRQVASMSANDLALAIIKSGEALVGREMTQEERINCLLQMAAGYEDLAAGMRRLAAGPQLRLVPPPSPDAAGEG